VTALASQNDLWFRRFERAEQSGVRLICLPHAGGSASFYLPVSRALSPSVEVVAAQYPGRQDRRREACIESVEALADALYEAVLPWCDRPIALFGHSMGATLGYELGRRIEEGGTAELVHLFASGRRAPSAHRDERVHERDDDGVIEELKKLSGTNSRILGDEEIMRMALPAIRGDYKAAETYVFGGGARLRCPITVLTGDADPKTTLDEARRWSAHSEQDVDVRVFVGGHFFLADHQAEINGLIKQRLLG